MQKFQMQLQMLKLQAENSIEPRNLSSGFKHNFRLHQ